MKRHLDQFVGALKVDLLGTRAILNPRPFLDLYKEVIVRKRLRLKQMVEMFNKVLKIPSNKTIHPPVKTCLI